MKDTAPPSDIVIANLCQTLTKQLQKQERDRRLAPVKTVLTILGAGAAISAMILAPGTGRVIAPFLKSESDWEQWKHFNPSYLRRTLKRLQDQRVIEIQEKNGQNVIVLTSRGKQKILKYSMETLGIEKPKRWDGKWRLVLYDIPVKDKSLGDVMRQTLRTLGFYAIQDSAYIYPYPCFDQIEFLRSYYGLGDYIQYMLVDKIERDLAFKTYFNLS